MEGLGKMMMTMRKFCWLYNNHHRTSTTQTNFRPWHIVALPDRGHHAAPSAVRPVARRQYAHHTHGPATVLSVLSHRGSFSSCLFAPSTRHSFVSNKTKGQSQRARHRRRVLQHALDLRVGRTAGLFVRSAHCRRFFFFFFFR
jgi:hypothetical protein